MSYIHCYGDNYYKPSEDLQELFEKQILHPLEIDLPIHAQKIKQVDINALTYQRYVIGRGRTNFDEPFEGFSATSRVSLYCVHYMPMHLFSSYHIFKNHLSLISDKVIFIDFGCGPLTSGVAFWAAFAGQCDITYIGIDSSQTMLNKAQEINQDGPYRYGSEPFYESVHLIRDYNQLPGLLDNIEMSNPADTLVVFNFCYFFQSKTFEDPSKIEELGELLYFSDIGTKICIMYQDPVGDGFQERWHNFKSWVITYPSMYDVSGFGWQDPTKVVSVKYDTLWGEQRPIKVSHDNFNNFYYHDHYRHR